MKKLVLATATLLGLSTAAMAAPQGWVNGEYAVSEKVISLETGVDFAVNSFTVTPSVVVDNSADDFAISATKVNVAYTFNDNASTYVTISGDSSLSYTDTVVGIRLNF